MNDKTVRPIRTARRGERPRNHHLIRCGTVRGLLRAPAYRIGEEYHWQTNDPRAERVTVGIDPECRFGLDASGEVLIYRRRCPAWFPLTSAMLLGWCWVAEPDNCGSRIVEGFVAGEHFTATAAHDDAEPVELWLRDGTRYILDEEGRYLFFRGEWGVGFPLAVALSDGWCSPEKGGDASALRPLDWSPPPHTSAERQRISAA